MKEYWKKIREIHFDPINGAPFWLKRCEEKKIDPFSEIHGIEDFWKLGNLKLETLRNTPPGDFLPKNIGNQLLIPIESGGTAGEPVLTFFSQQEFYDAFIAPFLEITENNSAATQGKWLYVGPTGPHAIGRAARLCSSILTNQEAYTIDFDPRWAKKLPPGSIAAERYLEHLCEQVVSLARKIDFSFLFATPPLLNALCQKLDKNQKENISGIQLGGMDVQEEEWTLWRENFPNAQFIIGYGNSLVGVSYFCNKENGYVVNSSLRTYISITDAEINCKEASGNERKGQIVVHRLDATVLYLNLCERDQATIAQKEKKTILRNIEPLFSTTETIKKGLY